MEEKVKYEITICSCVSEFYSFAHEVVCIVVKCTKLHINNKRNQKVKGRYFFFFFWSSKCVIEDKYKLKMGRHFTSMYKKQNKKQSK